MYQFSRAIYRELAADIDVTPARQRRARAACCARARPTIERLVDRPPLLRAAGADAVQRHPHLLPDVRAAARLARRRSATSTARDECLDRMPAATASTSTASRCSAARRRAAARRASAMPLPHNGYCPSHQHLAETEELELVAPRPRPSRSPRSAAPARREPRPASLGSRAMLLGRRRRRHLHRRRPRRRRASCTPPRRRRRPTTSRAGVHGRRRARARGAPARGAGDVEGFAHGMTVATNALLEGTARAPRSSPPRASPTSSSSAARRARELYRLCAAHPAPLVAARAALRRARAHRARRRAASALDATLDGARRRGRRRRARGGRGRACCTPTATPSTSARSATRSRERCPASTSRSRTRSSARSASTSAPRRPRSTPRSRRCSARYLRRLARRARATRACPTPAIMQSSGGLADARRRGRPRRAHRAQRPGRRRGGGGAARRALRRARPAVLRHGRHVVRRLRRRGRRACARPPAREVGGRPLALPMVDIHTVGAGGGSIAWRDPGGALRVGPALARAPSPGPACYGRGGTEPTVTDANLVLGHLERRRAAGRRRRRSTPTRRTRAVGALADELGLDARATAPRASCASPTPRWSARCA